jgi:SsrA-binding protein
VENISKNKKALVDYEVLETFEAGIVLAGPEVKSIKGNDVNLKGSFIDSSFAKGKYELWVNGMHVSPYKFAQNNELNPTRKRKLLLNKKEIITIVKTLNEKGMTCVPLEIYLKGGLIKVKIGIVRGKKNYDKRNDLKKKAQNLEVSKALKKYSRK